MFQMMSASTATNKNSARIAQGETGRKFDLTVDV